MRVGGGRRRAAILVSLLVVAALAAAVVLELSGQAAVAAEQPEQPLRPAEVGFLSWFATDRRLAHETYTVRRYADGVRIEGRIESAAAEASEGGAAPVRSRLVLDASGRPDSLYLWPRPGAPAEISAVPDSLRPLDPYPFDARAGLYLLAWLVARHAPAGSVDSGGSAGSRGSADSGGSRGSAGSADERVVPLVPAGAARIRWVAVDSVDAAGAHLVVRRYRVAGLPGGGTWWLWLNEPDQRPLAGLSLAAGRGAAAEGFGPVLRRLARYAWEDEGPAAGRRMAAAARRFTGPVVFAGAGLGAGVSAAPGVRAGAPVDLVVEDGLLRAVVAAGSAAPPAGAARVELAGRTVVAGRVLEDGAVAPDSLVAALAHGYTTVVARRGYLGEVAAAAIDSLDWIGPRVVAGGGAGAGSRAGTGAGGPATLRSGLAADFLILADGEGGGSRLEAVVCRGALIDPAALR